jgi:hypothetical protein
VGDWTKLWLLRDRWQFNFFGDTPLKLVKGRGRSYFEHFWNDFAADPNRSPPEAQRRLYARKYSQPRCMRAGFEYFRNFPQTAADFAEFAKTPLPMPILVLGGEKASAGFLIPQVRLKASFTGVPFECSLGHQALAYSKAVADDGKPFSPSNTQSTLRRPQEKFRWPPGLGVMARSDIGSVCLRGA